MRVRLLKIGVRIRITVRKVWLSFCEASPYVKDIAQSLANLQRHPAWSPPAWVQHQHHPTFMTSSHDG